MNNQFQINGINLQILHVFPETVLNTFNDKINYVKTIKVDLIAIYTDISNVISGTDSGIDEITNLKLSCQSIEITDKLSDVYISFDDLKSEDFYPTIINYFQNSPPENFLKEIAYARVRSGIDPDIPFKFKSVERPIKSIPFSRN